MASLRHRELQSHAAPAGSVDRCYQACPARWGADRHVLSRHVRAIELNSPLATVGDFSVLCRWARLPVGAGKRRSACALTFYREGIPAP